jgi:hypothetical protein
VVTIDNHKQLISIVPITKKGSGNNSIVTHIYVFYSNWFGHTYLVLDKSKSFNLLKDQELIDDLFKVADYVFNCNSALEQRESCGMIDWLFGDGIICPEVGKSRESFWDRLLKNLKNIFEDAGTNTSNNGSDFTYSMFYSDWSNYNYFGYAYDNNSATYYSQSNGGSTTYNNADPSETLEPDQILALQVCVNNSHGIKQTIEQSLNEFALVPNIQNIIADRLLENCMVSSSITSGKLQEDLASFLITELIGDPLFQIQAIQVIAEYKGLEKAWISSNGQSPNTYNKAKLLFKAFWNVTSETAHTTLDMCGLIPAYGEFCDLTNGVLYVVQGDYAKAGFSFAAMIPFVGWTATTGKHVAYAVKTVSGKVVNLPVQLINNIVDFGSRNDLRRALDLGSSSLQAHHLVPWEHRNHAIIQRIGKNANKNSDFLHMNHPKNGLAVAAWRNQPNHNQYNQRVLQGLNAIQTKFGLNDAKILKTEMLKFASFLRSRIDANPNSHIDNIIFTYIP